MRAYGNQLGKFDQLFEMSDIQEGINYDLTNFVGSLAYWWVYSHTDLDPVYNVGNDDGTGRVWNSPINVKVTRNLWSRGTNEDRGTGFYNVDTLHLTIDALHLLSKIPDLLESPDVHSKDRVVYEGLVYRPISLQPRGVIGTKYALLVVDLQQISGEEMINDEQFQEYV